MITRFRPLACTLLAASSLILSPLASADLLVLKNGDSITGEIKSNWDAEITIEPSYSDEFDVDAAIAGVVSAL